MNKESVNILVDTNGHDHVLKKPLNLEIGGQNIITLAIAIVIASYLSDIILYLLDDAILPIIYSLIDKLGNKEIKIGIFKLDINKTIKHTLRFIILIILLVVILMTSKMFKFIN